MKQILEALWDGQIAPGQTNGVRDPEMEHLTVLMDRSRTELEGELTAVQKEKFRKYIDCADEFASLGAAQAFCEGFSLATKLLTAALSQG